MAQAPRKPHQNFGVGSTNGVGPIIDEDGNIFFFDGNQKTVVGKDRLVPPDGERVIGPVNVACSSAGAGEGCIVVDGAGNVWIGPARPGTPYGKPVTKLT